jgi:hypothetical protein
MKSLLYFHTLLAKLFGNIWLGFIAAGLGIFLDFILPVRQFILFTFILVVCDSITGIMAYKVRSRASNIKIKIEAFKLKKTISKIVLYFIAILLAEGMKVTFMPGIPIPFVVAFAIATVEFKSNIENIETVTGITIWSSVKDLFTKNDNK